MLRTRGTSQQPGPLYRFMLIDIIEDRTSPATPRKRHKPQAATEAEHICKKQCSASDTRPNYTPRKKNTEEAAARALHTAKAV